MLRVVIARDFSPERLARVGAGLLRQEIGSATLLVAELDGPCVLLGRHQRATSALDVAAAVAGGRRVARRLGGGKTLLCAPGTVGVLLVVPPGAGLEEIATPERALNRYVRGLLRGLGGVGAARGAFYFGRDFVSADKQQVAIVSQDGAPGGTVLFEAFVAVHAPLALPAGLSRYPVHGDPRAAGPPHACLAALWAAGGRTHTFDELAEAIVSGYARSTGATVQRASLDELGDEAEDPTPDVIEREDGFAWSGVADVPIGFVEALVRADDGRALEVRLRGDFIAPTFVVRELEAALAGCPLELAAVGAHVDAAFTRRGATMIGVTQLRVLAEAIVACRAETA